jgi:hypothetical protein
MAIDMENLPMNDPAALMAAFEELQVGAAPVEDAKPNEAAKPDEAAAAAAAKTPDTPVDATVKQDQQEDKSTQKEPEADGVLTKDGKHVIPYSVLNTTRDRASRAEEALRQATERVAALEAMVKPGNQGAKDGEGARTEPTNLNASDLSPEDLEALKEDFPTVYKGIVAMQKQIASFDSRVKPVEESVRDTEQDRARTAADAVQDAIDAVPKLAHMQATNADAFELAKQFDATLRNTAAWKDKPLAERFAKITEMVEGTLGPITLPTPAKPEPALNAAELKAAAQAKAADAAKATKTAVPTSLSEFPIGDPAAKDERDAVENMTHQQLAAKLSSMSPDQMDAYFSTL